MSLLVLRKSPQAGTLEFCPVLEELVTLRRAVGKSGKEFTNLGALSTKNNLYSLRQLMLELKPRRTLEVGLAFGGSALAFAATHRDLGHLPSRQHVALDPFQSTTWDDCGIESITRARLEDFLDFRPVRSSVELPKLLAERSRFGLIYLDGSHLFEDVFVDSYFGARLLEENGVLVFDDSTNRHVRKTLAFIRSSLGTKLRQIDLSFYRPDRGRPLSYRLARAIGRVQMTAFQRVDEVERSWDAPFHAF